MKLLDKLFQRQSDKSQLEEVDIRLDEAVETARRVARPDCTKIIAVNGNADIYLHCAPIYPNYKSKKWCPKILNQNALSNPPIYLGKYISPSARPIEALWVNMYVRVEDVKTTSKLKNKSILTKRN